MIISYVHRTTLQPFTDTSSASSTGAGAFRRFPRFYSARENTEKRIFWNYVYLCLQYCFVFYFNDSEPNRMERETHSVEWNSEKKKPNESQWQIMMHSMIIKNKSNLNSRELLLKPQCTFVMRKQWLHIDEMFNCCMCWTKWLKDFLFLSTFFHHLSFSPQFVRLKRHFWSNMLRRRIVSDELTLMWICNSLRHEHREMCVRFIRPHEKKKK